MLSIPFVYGVKILDGGQHSEPDACRSTAVPLMFSVINSADVVVGYREISLREPFEMKGDLAFLGQIWTHRLELQPRARLPA